MRIASAMLLINLGFLCWALNSHSVILRFDHPVDITQELSEYHVVAVEQLPGRSIYRVEIDTSLTYQELSHELRQNSRVVDHEPNQKGIIDGPTAAATIDQRPILVLDQRPILVLDQRPILVLDEGGRLAAGTESHMNPLYYQPFLQIIGAQQAWEQSAGQGVTVAVLDTGVDARHPLIADNLHPNGYDFVDEDPDPNDERMNIDTNGNGQIDEGWGHGTHIAGIIKLVAPGVSVLPIRVIDSDGVGDLFDILQGLEYALDQGADIVNLSLSIPEPSPLLERWLRDARRENVLVVTSAGNQNTDQLMFPATHRKVLTVASIDNNGNKSTFSNFGADVDVAAPGEYVLSALPGGNTYVERDGTSMTAPMVSGQAALIKELHPSLNFNGLTNRIKHNAFDLDLYNPDYFGLLGRGMIYIPDSL